MEMRGVEPRSSINLNNLMLVVFCIYENPLLKNTYPIFLIYRLSLGSLPDYPSNVPLFVEGIMNKGSVMQLLLRLRNCHLKNHRKTPIIFTYRVESISSPLLLYYTIFLFFCQLIFLNKIYIYIHHHNVLSFFEYLLGFLYSYTNNDMEAILFLLHNCFLFYK